MPTKKHKKIEKAFPWYERIRWDRLYEKRKQILFLFFALIVIVWVVSSFASKRESSAISQTLKGELSVIRLTRPPSTDQKIVYEEELDTLLSLLSQSSSLANRFAGVAAQEEILQNRELSTEWFELAINRLDEANLPLYSSIVRATQESEQNENTKALEILNEILSVEETNSKVQFYALLQKAFLLKKIDQPNGEVIEKIETLIEKDPDIVGLFDVWMRDTPTNVLSFLKKE